MLLLCKSKHHNDLDIDLQIGIRGTGVIWGNAVFYGGASYGVTYTSSSFVDVDVLLIPKCHSKGTCVTVTVGYSNNRW